MAAPPLGLCGLRLAGSLSPSEGLDGVFVKAEGPHEVCVRSVEGGGIVGVAGVCTGGELT